MNKKIEIFLCAHKYHKSFPFFVLYGYWAIIGNSFSISEFLFQLFYALVKSAARVNWMTLLRAIRRNWRKEMSRYLNDYACACDWLVVFSVYLILSECPLLCVCVRVCLLYIWVCRHEDRFFHIGYGEKFSLKKWENHKTLFSTTKC